MTDIIGNPLIRTKWRPYTSFAGINRSRDISALEIDYQNPRPQPFWVINNASISLQGRLDRDPFLYRRNTDADLRSVESIRLMTGGDAVWVEADDQGKNIVTSRNEKIDYAYELNDAVSMARVKGQVFIMSSGYQMKIFNGVSFADSQAPVHPGFGVYIQGRLFVAGLPNKPSEVHASRAGDLSVFPDNENPSSAATAKAAFLQIQDAVSSSGEIVALGGFEGDRLAVFTSDQTVVYKVSPDYSQWSIDSRAVLEIGCLGQKSVVKIGQDLVFCSRYGVHVLSRSDANGLTILPLFLSDDIVDLYKSLVKVTEDVSLISSFFDADERTLHVFFPNNKTGSIRLSVRIKQDYQNLNWSTATFKDMRCGDSLAGDIVFGTGDGVWSTDDRVIDMSERIIASTGERPELTATTPVLWHGNMFDDKRSEALLLHVVGSGTLSVTAYDDQGNEMQSISEQISYGVDQDDNPPQGVPLGFEYRVTFRQTYRGLVLNFESGDDGDIGIIGFAVELKE